MPSVQFSAAINSLSADSVLIFEKAGIFLDTFPFQNLLIDVELSRCVMICKDGVNIFLGDSKSGGLLIPRFFDGLSLFFFGRKGVT